MRKNGTPIPRLRRDSRRKLLLTVDEQRRLITGNLDGSGGLGRALSRLILSVGTHLVVLERPKDHNLKWNQTYYTYTRPKNYRPVQGPWSKAMQDDAVINTIAMNLGCSTRWFNACLAEAGEDAELGERIGQEMLRQNYFANRARAGHSLPEIVHSSGTSLGTVMDHYTAGMRDMRALGQDDIDWLKWLLEV